MKPFLLLQSRPEDLAVHDEFETTLRFSGLQPQNLVSVRMEKGDLPNIKFRDYSGVIVGGGPYNVSDSDKPPEQIKLESWLYKLLDQIIEMDFPFLGECYGLGILSTRLGGKVSKDKYSEPVGAIDVKILPGMQNDPLLKGLKNPFRAFVGHKEACQSLAPDALHLAESDSCPIQMIKHKQNIYATQFHPTLDGEATALRIKVYKNAGYFKPEEADELIAAALTESILAPAIILKRFVELYAKT